MWVSKKKWESIEKRIADLEEKVQSQQKVFIHHLNCHKEENEEFKEIIREMRKGV